MRVSDQEFNRLNVLKAIRRAEPVARSELVKLTGLSGATMTEIVGDLLGRGFLLEEKAAPGGMGRRRLELRLNPDAARVVGAFLLPEGALNVQICNLRGDTLFSLATPIGDPPTFDAFAERMAAIINETIAASPFAKSELDSVGLALPAIVDSLTGNVHWFQIFPAQTSPIASIIEALVHLPVVVDNSANVIARAEHWFGEDRQLDDFSLFTLGLGLGFGRYVDGVLWTGAHGINPEMGHVKVGMDGGPRCYCGGRGCLVTYASMSAIAYRLSDERGLPPPQVHAIESRFRDFATAARGGDQAALAAFDDAGRALGAVIASYINAWDPERIVILAMNPDLADLMRPPFYAALQENTLPALRGRAPVQFQVDDEARYSHGAAAMVLERIYRASGRLGSPAGKSPSRGKRGVAAPLP